MAKKLDIKIDPTKFIVRHPLLPQDKEYPGKCAAITENLFTYKVNSANDLIHAIVDEGKKYKYINPHYEADNQKNSKAGKYLKISPRRPEQAFQFSLDTNGKVSQYQLSRELFGKGIIKRKIYYKYEDETGFEGPVIVLAQPEIIRDSDTGLYVFPQKKRQLNAEILEVGKSKITEEWNHSENEQHLWNAISLNFLRVINRYPKQNVEGKVEYMDLSPEKRYEAAITLYSLLSFNYAFESGTATSARIALEYCIARINRETGLDFEVPYTKENVNLNIKALERTPGEFLEDWKKKDFFDKDVKRAEILAWQAEVIAKSDFQQL